jgi:hypothetical protein
MGAVDKWWPGPNADQLSKGSKRRENSGGACKEVEKCVLKIMMWRSRKERSMHLEKSLAVTAAFARPEKFEDFRRDIDSGMD